MVIFVVNFILTEYDFEKSIYTDCVPRGDLFNKLEEAKKECKFDKQCQGVLNVSSSDYYLCSSNSTKSSQHDSNGSLLKKIIIGKW